MLRVKGMSSDVSFVLLRVVSGLMFSFHGLQKIGGVLTDHQPAFGSQLWWGGLIELVCGLAIAAGAFTRLAALLASGTMAVAYVQFHWKLALGTQLLPGVNRGELALLYCVVFFFFVFHGGGRLGVDAGRARGKRA